MKEETRAEKCAFMTLISVMKTGTSQENNQIIIIIMKIIIFMVNQKFTYAYS